ncbi:lysine transporter LysE [Enterovibrio norvegicus FF-33]|uniref:Lysine transporter LysE n=1 Tax=Enterovibrio norvegicus FF-454 TaxID=1185651 RepID=A0A1E5C0Q1_9GAMM|nr:LysE family translocator [Enterovibrio norvegicus]OEE59097.1 lysine transporter LysE [Enterovibrio norvegicus FF-454]OEE67746.1 lysine transporter LysE [Enterovibrio norvegicus FF-33]OEE85947.1 lysine transporter LysE [Enterovibrio norvegicus FF-162]
MTVETWLAFLSIAFLAALSPGPAILLVMTHSLRSGLGKALFTVAGNITGLFIMSSFSVLGLSALVLSSATAFMVIKLLGACYLVYLGIKVWRNGIEISLSDAPDTNKTRSYYLQGVLVALTNPKAIVFTTALFPQFIEISQPLIPQFSILVVTLMCCSITCLSGYGYWGVKALKRSKSLTTSKWLPRTFGGTFIGIGAMLALTAQR